ncbi:MAG: bifunctional DNA-formamidopyrimidine glycosylase/DNA-(apurinic or apyrimidinic site) lyase [Thermoleophilia bacterium]
MSTLPELPEVETIRRQLAPYLSGKKIARAEVLDPLITSPADPGAFVRRLKGQTIESLWRRGKYLLLELESGQTLVFHLRMTGRLTRTESPVPKSDKRHLRLILEFAGGSALTFHDTRRFGKAFILSTDEAPAYWKKLGPEPLESSFNNKYLAGVLDKRTRPIKSLLLDQSLIAGIGNIYADEALYRAGIHPERPAGEIGGEEARRLAKALKETLKKAIKLGGSSIDSYRDARGRSGSFQHTFRVHRREGEPCPGCGGIVKKIKVGGRGTYFCPACQR